MEHILQIVVSLTVAGVLGLVANNWRLHAEVNALKLHIAENYIKKDALQELKEDVKKLSNIMHEIAGKLNANTGA